MAKKLTEDELKWILSVDATKAQQEVRALSKDNGKLNTTNKELKDRMIDLIATGKKESEEFNRLSKEVEQNNEKIDKNKAKIKALEGTMGISALTMAQLRKQAKDLQRQLDNTSQATHPEEWNQLNQNLLEVRSRMDELKASGKKTEETLGDTITSSGKIATFLGNMYTKAAEWAMEALSKAKEFVAEGIKMAGMAQGVERAFNRISTPGMLNELRQSTKGMVNDLQLMQSAVKAHNFKIPLEELGTLLRFAQQRAQETGESVDYLTESIVTGIGRQSPLILDNLGISAKRLSDEVAKTGDFAKAVGKIVREELSKSGETIDTAADKAQQRAVLLQNIQMSIGQRMIGIVNSAGSAWTSFLDVINRWVSIPTVEKLRDEQRETNILARSIMAAEGRTESRNLLIQEMQRQYPSFLANLDMEKLTNEQLAERLREVNGEYENRLRVQVMNDKILSPLQEKQRNLIEEEMNGITGLNEMVELYGKYITGSFKEAIKSGDILKMSTKEIDEQLVIMRQRGAAVGLTVGIDKIVKRLKDIPDELKTVDTQIQTTIEKVSSFGKPKQTQTGLLQPLSQQVSLIEHISSLRKQAAEEMKENTEEEIKAKNQVLKKYDDEIARLKSLGIEKEKKKKNPYEEELKAVDEYVSQEQLKLKENYLQGLSSREEYNRQLETLELEALNRRMDIYQLDGDKQIEILNKIQDYKIRILEQNQKFEESQQKYRNKFDKKEKQGKEKALNDELQRIAADNKVKQQKQYEEETAHQERLKELALGFSTDIGSIVGGAIAGNDDLVKSSLVSIINMGLDALELTAQMAAAEAVIKGGAQGGLIGLAKGAIVAGLIKAAFSAVKALVSSSINNIGGKNNSSTSISTGIASDTGSRVITGKQDGGYLNVVREQDGKEFNAVVDPNKRGYVDKPTVIVGDGPAGKSREWVASNDALQNPTVVPFINVLNESQEKGEIRTVDMNQLMRKRLAGFESGGSISPSTSSTPPVVSTPSSPIDSLAGSETIKKLYDLLHKIDKEGFRAYVVYSDIERKKQTLDKTRRLGGK